ncbi:MAG: TauD/TfdA family dioxygenase [Verrucomicrobiota bacterium]
MSSSTPDPSRWTADELVARDDWRLCYGDASVEAIRELLENGPGIVLLSEFPLADSGVDEARQRFLDWCGTIGTPLSQNEKGDPVFDVANAGFAADDPRSRGPNTKRSLSFHTDRCDVIAFLCWRQARVGGENEIVSSRLLHDTLLERRPDLVEILRETFVYKRHTVDLGNELPYVEQPIFSFCEGQFACAFLRVLIDRADKDPELPDLSDAQREALDELEKIAAEAGHAIQLLQQPGDVLLVNNWTTLHRRSGFEDHPDPENQRRLFRVWLSMPNSRPIDPRFAANYGATDGGAIRGGFRVNNS